MDTLALGFWPRLPALRNYGVLTKLMLKLAVPHADKGVVGKRKIMHADDDRQVATHAALKIERITACGASPRCCRPHRECTGYKRSGSWTDNQI